MSGQNEKAVKNNHDPIDDIDPTGMMEDVARSHLGKTIAISLVVHILFIGALSIGYIGQCVKYKTFAVKEKVKEEKDRIRKEDEEKKRQVLLKQAQEEATRRETEKKKTQEAQQSQQQTADSGVTETDGQRVPKVLQEINEVSSERPQPGMISLDKELDIQELVK